jgi:hypothetical protein
MVFSSVSLSIWRGRQLVTEGEDKKEDIFIEIATASTSSGLLAKLEMTAG